MSDEPEKVIIAPVKVVAPQAAPPKPAQVGDLNTAPTTTAADDLRTASQRRVNLIWEVTQSAIAIAVTLSVLYVSSQLIINSKPGETSREAAFLLISNAFFLVVSVYIQRTNHRNVGGVQKGDTGR